MRSVTIIAPTPTRTDGLTKSRVHPGRRSRASRFVDGAADADAIVVAADGKVLYSKGLAPPSAGA